MTDILTPQSIFDKVCDHLMKQGKKSIYQNTDGFSCAYRGNDDTKCAVGCLIPDELYNKEMEGSTVWTLVHHGLHYEGAAPINEWIKANLADHQELLSELQAIHDGYEPEEWKELLQKLAKFAKVTPPASIT